MLFQYFVLITCASAFDNSNNMSIDYVLNTIIQLNQFLKPLFRPSDIMEVSRARVFRCWHYVSRTCTPVITGSLYSRHWGISIQHVISMAERLLLAALGHKEHNPFAFGVHLSIQPTAVKLPFYTWVLLLTSQ